MVKAQTKEKQGANVTNRVSQFAFDAFVLKQYPEMLPVTKAQANAVKAAVRGAHKMDVALFPADAEKNKRGATAQNARGEKVKLIIEAVDANTMTDKQEAAHKKAAKAASAKAAKAAKKSAETSTPAASEVSDAKAEQ